MNTIMLIVTSMSLLTGSVHVNSYPMKDMAECVSNGKRISANVKTSRVLTACWKAPGSSVTASS